ncbi:hypothetical protein Hanom_Chr10g00945261 [Helianthus anomalus]
MNNKNKYLVECIIRMMSMAATLTITTTTAQRGAETSKFYRSYFLTRAARKVCFGPQRFSRFTRSLHFIIH